MAPFVPGLRKQLSRLAHSGVRASKRLLPATPGPAILMYHRIAKESFDPWGLAVSPENFAAQMEWLASERTVLRLAEFGELHRRGGLPRTAIAITFDDGYACTIAAAAPLLERLGLPATVFLPAELIDRGREFWWDELEYIVLDHEGPTLLVGTRQIALGARHETDREWPPGAPPRTPRQMAFRAIWAMLKPRAPVELDRAMAQLRAQADLPERPRATHRPMTGGELRQRVRLLDVGSHALTHPSLPALRRAEKAAEIFGSIEQCEALSGSRPTTFAYPYGDFDRESAQLVKEAGFSCACTARQSRVSPGANSLAMPRLAIGNWSADRLASLLRAP